MVPGTDECGAFFKRVIAARDDFKRIALGLHGTKAGRYPATGIATLSTRA
jgi:hypothetical protein